MKQEDWYLISGVTENWMLIPAFSPVQALRRARLFCLAFPELGIPPILSAVPVEDIEEPINARLGIVPVSFFEAHELIEAGKERERHSGADVHVLLPPDIEQ